MIPGCQPRPRPCPRRTSKGRGHNNNVQQQQQQKLLWGARDFGSLESCALKQQQALWLCTWPNDPEGRPNVFFSFYVLFLGSIFIDQGPRNETRPSSSLDAEPPQPLKGTSSWFDRGPRPGAIRTATM